MLSLVENNNLKVLTIQVFSSTITSALIRLVSLLPVELENSTVSLYDTREEEVPC